MLRIISANLNGIRSAAKKGFIPWALQQKADFICMQELKAQEPDLDEGMMRPAGLLGFFTVPRKKAIAAAASIPRTNRMTSFTVLVIPSLMRKGVMLRPAIKPSRLSRCTCLPAQARQSAKKPSFVTLRHLCPI
jgi:exonuclease III